jgi:hypothetical protein
MVMKDGWVARTIGKGLEGGRLSQEASSPPGDKGHFRGSDVGCGRKIIFGRFRVRATNPLPGVVIEKMDKGSALHDYIRNYLLPQAGFEVWHQEYAFKIPVEIGRKTFHVSGKIDGILVHKGKPLALLEIKTTGSWGYKGVLRSGFNGEHYSDEYFTQANRYAHLWNQAIASQDPKDPNWKPTIPLVNGICILLYNVGGEEDPETGVAMRDFWFDQDIIGFRKDMTRLRGLEELCEAKELPPHPYQETDFLCKGCQYKKVCWSGQAEAACFGAYHASSRSTKKESVGSDPGRTKKRTLPRPLSGNLAGSAKVSPKKQGKRSGSKVGAATTHSKGGGKALVRNTVAIRRSAGSRSS